MDPATKKHWRISQLGRWLAELILVFVGVYAAFWLNSYQQHREQVQRRDQILAYLQQRLQHGIDSAKRDGVQQEKQVAEFQRALAAGQMPPLRPFAFFTDYNPADIATLLQAAGIELLDIKTLTVLREMETDVRTDLSTLAHFEKLSDEMIAPNLDQDISFFYDPATKKLRKRFEKYPDGLKATVKLFHDMETTQTNLLTQVQAERQRRNR